MVARKAITRTHSSTQLPFRKANSSPEQTFIVLRLGAFLGRAALVHVLEKTQIAMTNIKVISHCRWSPSDFSFANGAKLVVFSNERQHRELKYETILKVARGLMHVLIAGHRYNEAHFSVWKAGLRVGGGTIRST